MSTGEAGQRWVRPSRPARRLTPCLKAAGSQVSAPPASGHLSSAPKPALHPLPLTHTPWLTEVLFVPKGPKTGVRTPPPHLPPSHLEPAGTDLERRSRANWKQKRRQREGCCFQGCSPGCSRLWVEAVWNPRTLFSSGCAPLPSVSTATP